MKLMEFPHVDGMLVCVNLALVTTIRKNTEDTTHLYFIGHPDDFVCVRQTYNEILERIMKMSAL
jgi:hypothetical protein